MKTILVTGGAGYIGSFMTKRLLDEGYSVVVADSLERGRQEVIDERAEFSLGNFLDKSFVSRLFKNYEIDAVIHFAAYISMAESMEKPELYFENNVFAAHNVIEAIKTRSIPFILSSTAGVYGNPVETPITEDHPKNPTNPYGESKLMVERILAWYHTVYNLPYACLRYFNASGASSDGMMGEDHHPESHIIPNIVKAALENRAFTLYGSDYDTPDGTAVRDYIHVYDLVEAHLLALKKLSEESLGLTYNVGTGKGYSNKEVFEMVKLVSGQDIELKLEGRRPGDASMLVADATKIQNELGFNPRFSELQTIVQTAWKWHSNRQE